MERGVAPLCTPGVNSSCSSLSCVLSMVLDITATTGSAALGTNWDERAGLTK